MSTSKNSTLKIKTTFDENFQFFGPYYADPFNTGPINATQRKLAPLGVGVKEAGKVLRKYKLPKTQLHSTKDLL